MCSTFPFDPLPSPRPSPAPHPRPYLPVAPREAPLQVLRVQVGHTAGSHGHSVLPPERANWGEEQHHRYEVIVA